LYDLETSVFWPQAKWMRWGAEMGWAPNIVRGRTEEDAARITLLAQAIADDAPEEFTEDEFQPLHADERQIALAAQVQREGQGAFRARLLDAYEGRCCITGEHTEPVLDAAHIQPYLGPRSNHVQNGLLLTKEFHTLFDRGYVTVTPDLRVRVSPRLREDWKNGRRYYPYDGQQLLQVPDSRSRPNASVLAWHNERVFRRVA
jgi:putative restriction endonuclease